MIPAAREHEPSRAATPGAARSIGCGLNALGFPFDCCWREVPEHAGWGRRSAAGAAGALLAVVLIARAPPAARLAMACSC